MTQKWKPFHPGCPRERGLAPKTGPAIQCGPAASGFSPMGSTATDARTVRFFQTHGFEHYVGVSLGNLRALDLAYRVAPEDYTVLIQGETGTGKQILAEAIHRNSPRAKDIFFIMTNVVGVLLGLRHTIIKNRQAEAVASLHEKINIEFAEIPGFVSCTRQDHIKDLDAYLRHGARSNDYPHVDTAALTDDNGRALDADRLRAHMIELIGKFVADDQLAVARVLLMVLGEWLHDPMFNFYTINCGELPHDATVFNTELFGVVSGTFHEVPGKPGIFQLASYVSGTVFIDEIGDLPWDSQGCLRRVLDTQNVRRMGARQDEHLNIRIVSATNKNLLAEVACGRFHKDLPRRLPIRIETLPLRARREDIPVLAKHFLRNSAAAQRKGILTFDHAAMKCLGDHSWSENQNAGELKNVVERAVLFCDQSTISAEHVLKAFPPDEERPVPSMSIKSAIKGFKLARDKEEREEYRRLVIGILDNALREAGNTSAAARLLGVDRRTLRTYWDLLTPPCPDRIGSRVIQSVRDRSLRTPVSVLG